MRRFRAFLLDELLLAQAVPGFVLCVGWAVMYEIYHEDGSYYTTLMQEILGGDGLYTDFLISAVLMAFPVGLVVDAVREVLAERWLGIPRARAARRTTSPHLPTLFQALLPPDTPETRYALYRHARATLLTPAKTSGNLAVVLLALLVWFVVKIVRMQGWHVFSLTFIIGTPVIGLGIFIALYVRYAAGLVEFRQFAEAITLGRRLDAAPPSDITPPVGDSREP
jgi:hypothetical protein